MRTEFLVIFDGPRGALAGRRDRRYFAKMAGVTGKKWKRQWSGDYIHAERAFHSCGAAKKALTALRARAKRTGIKLAYTLTYLRVRKTAAMGSVLHDRIITKCPRR